MRATTFIAGLFLTSTVLALPTPRPQDDITYDDPFHISKRVDLPSLPLKDLTSKVPVTDVTSKLPVSDLEGKLPVKLPARGLTDAVPTNELPTGELTDLTKDLPVSDLTSKIPVTLPNLPTRGLGDLTSTLTSVLDIVKPLLNTLLSSLSKADASVQKLLSDAEANAASIIATLEADLSSALDEAKSLAETLEADLNGGLDEIKTTVAQVEALATTLVADLEKLDASLPSVDQLISLAKQTVAKVQALGL